MSTRNVNLEVKEKLIALVNHGYSDGGGTVRPKYKDGVSAHTIFSVQDYCEYNLTNGKFYLPSLFHVPVITGIREARWIYQTQSNSLKDARSLGVSWWDSWDIGDGTIGLRYGAIVKKYDLVNNLIEGLKNNPFGRRHIMDIYDQSEFNSPGLYPCAFLSMWTVREWGGIKYLDMSLIQRSSDYLVASWINKSQYVFLQMILAHSLGMVTGTFTHFTQNLHIYDRHIKTANNLLDKDFETGNVYMQMKKGTSRKSFYEYTEKDFEVVNENNIVLEKLGLEVAI